MKIHTFLITLACISLTGCETFDTRQAVLVGGGAVGGSAIAGEIDDSEWSYAAGALIGSGAGLLANNYLSNKEEREFQEAYDQGVRDATVKHMNELWQDRLNPKNEGTFNSNTTETSGVYNGVMYLPRPAQTDPYALYDPAR